MSIDVCEGCRRLRKRCDKDACVLQPCLESLWPHNKIFQGNATVFLAKYFGRKRFFELLQDVTKDERPALFRSLLQEACGRTVNPVSGAIGLKTSGRWHLCEQAVENVLTAGSLNSANVSPDTSCLSTTNNSCSPWTLKAKRERDVEESDITRLPELVSDSRVRRRQPSPSDPNALVAAENLGREDGSNMSTTLSNIRMFSSGYDVLRRLSSFFEPAPSGGPSYEVL